MKLKAEDIEFSLSEDRSRANVDRWIDRIIADPECLPEIVKLLHEEPKLAFRIAWLLETLATKRPELLKHHVREMYDLLDQMTFSGYKRSLTKILSVCGVPEDKEGEVTELLFGWLNNSETEVAVKVHSMQTLYNLTLKYPDLKYELKAVLEDQMDRNTVAFGARARKLLKGLD